MQAVEHLRTLLDELQDVGLVTYTPTGFVLEDMRYGTLRFDENPAYRMLHLVREVHDHDGKPHLVPGVRIYMDAEGRWIPIAVSHPLLPKPAVFAVIDDKTLTPIDTSGQARLVEYLETLALTWRWLWLEPQSVMPVGDWLTTDHPHLFGIPGLNVSDSEM